MKSKEQKYEELIHKHKVLEARRKITLQNDDAKEYPLIKLEIPKCGIIKVTKNSAGWYNFVANILKELKP